MEEVFVDDFPVSKLNQLKNLLPKSLWSAIVIPGGELEILLDASIDFYKRGIHTKSEPCQNFIRKGLFECFVKLLTFDGPALWGPQFHSYIFRNALKLIDLIAVQLKQEDFSLVEILAIVFDPSTKFHTTNASRPPESYNMKTPPPDDELFARHFDVQSPKGWLVDLINRFGAQGGFDALLELFRTPKIPLGLYQIVALLKPFDHCVEFLTRFTAQKYFHAIHKIVLQFLDYMSLRSKFSVYESDEKVLLESVSRRVGFLSHINEAPKAEEGYTTHQREENLSEIKKLSEQLEKKEEALINLESNYKKLLQELSTTTEENKELQEQVKDLKNKLEMDSKDWKNKYETETNQEITAKLNEIQSYCQEFSLSIQGIINSESPDLPPTSSKSSKSKKDKKSSSCPKDGKAENDQNAKENPSQVQEQVVKLESPALSSSLTCPSPAYLEIFEENKNNLAIKILEKLSISHLLDARLVSKKWNQIIIPILHKKSSLEFSYTKQQNVHPLTSDLSLQKSLRRTLCQFNKVLQSARTIAEKSLFDDSSSSCSFPCLRFSFDLRALSKMEFNRGALYKFFTSHLNNFSTLKQLTLTESDEYLNGKMKQEHHEIILKILKLACNKIEHLDISGLYSTSNRSGIEIESSADRYFSKLVSMKTNGNLTALNGFILSSAPVLKNVNLCQYKNMEHLKIFEKNGSLDLIQRLEVKIPTTISSSQLTAVEKLPEEFHLSNLKVLKVWAVEPEQDSGDRRHRGKESNTKNQKRVIREMRSMIIKILNSVKNSLEILELGDSRSTFLDPRIEYPEFHKLHTLKYIQDAGFHGIGLLGNSSEFDGKFKNLTKIVLDLNYVSDEWSNFFEGTIPSVQSLEISNESFIRKGSDQSLQKIAASFPNLRKFTTCDPQRVHTQSYFLHSIWNHLKGLESLELTLGKKAASHGPALKLDSVITGISLSSCAMLYDSDKGTRFSISGKGIKGISIARLKDLKRFTLHLDDLSSLICQNKEYYPLLSKATGKFVAAFMPNLRVQICVPSSLLEKARETSISPFVTFVGKE